MLNSIRKISILGLMFAFVLVSCNGSKDAEQSKLLARKWTYKEFRMNDEVMSGDQMGNPTMEFLENGTYKAEFGMKQEEGEWRVEKGQLVSKPKGGDKENRLQIKELTAEQVVLYNEVDSNKATVTLVPVPQ